MAGDFARARNLLLGAVDTVLSLANQERAQGTASQNLEAGSGSSSLSRRSAIQEPAGSSSLSRRSAIQEPAGSSSQTSRWQTLNASIDEHRRLFGYRPRKSKTPFTRTKRNRGRRKGSSTWKKDCICLRDKEQTWKPSSEEKIELARMGLGLSEAVFNSDGDAEHIHQVLLEKFPVLESCGGYTLLRLAENSHSMVEIEGPDSGMTVSYLKDILNQAKLYIRPLQRDISEEDMKPYSIQNVRNLGL